MVVWPVVFGGAVATFFGWLYYVDPQRGFRYENFPHSRPGTKPLTRSGERSYEAQGVIGMALGILLIVVGLVV